MRLSDLDRSRLCQRWCDIALKIADRYGPPSEADFEEQFSTVRRKPERRFKMKRMVLAVGVLAVCFAALAESALEGVWRVKDTAGHPFEITLSSGGAAKATRGEGMSGTWKEEGNSAVITWNTGWTTKITKEGNRYTKTAYHKGQSLTATPANISEAEKTK